ncbi:hypothetical protein R1flu_029240 [Riccia fluitans]|uniref:Topoisomerase 6 subunit A/Spo11 TOPRIM domain-containing protein n=1 Tax=Riccia fluitans TaxID=41844 RepID=A0ABD1XNZ6_9MARC
MAYLPSSSLDTDETPCVADNASPAEETVFQRLASDRFYDFAPSIIITGKGYPDLATRVMLRRLHQAFPALPIFALVDWNPAGLAILCTYKFGSMRMGLETAHYGKFRIGSYLRSFCHAFARMKMSCHIMPVRKTPASRIKSLECLAGTEARVDFATFTVLNHEKYKRELAHMIDSQKRVEVEALHSNGEEFLFKFIADKIVQQGYI